MTCARCPSPSTTSARCESVSDPDAWGTHRCDLDDGHELPHQAELGLRTIICWPFQPRPYSQIGSRRVYLDGMDPREVIIP